VLAGEQGRGLQPLDLGGQPVQFRAHLARDIFTFSGQLEIGFEIREPAAETFVRLNLLFQAFALGQDFLGGYGVLPEIGAGRLQFELGELVLPRGSVKENSAARPRAALEVRIPVQVLPPCFDSRSRGQ
jgi:hypothetical protein